VQVYALTSSHVPDETLDLFITQEAAEAELREILEDEPVQEPMPLAAPSGLAHHHTGFTVARLNRPPRCALAGHRVMPLGRRLARSLSTD
jgi:hypothetical protein